MLKVINNPYCLPTKFWVCASHASGDIYWSLNSAAAISEVLFGSGVAPCLRDASPAGSSALRAVFHSWLPFPERARAADTGGQILRTLYEVTRHLTAGSGVY